MIDLGVLLAAGENGDEPARFWIAATSAAVVVLAFVFRELQRRREDLDKKVQTAVKASYGETLQQLRDSEASVTSKLEAAATRAAEIESTLQERLDTSTGIASQLEELLANAADVVPRLDVVRPVSPSLLTSQAGQADLTTGLRLLGALLALDDAGPDELRVGGTIAQQRFAANALARDLYRRAVELKPSDATAQVALTRLEVANGDLAPSEALDRARTLTRDHPNQRDVLSEALNVFVELDAYEEMLSFIDELTESGRESPLIWRDRAIALRELRQTEAVEEAFETALRSAQDEANSSEYANSARPYVAYLLTQQKLQRAGEVLEEALIADPTDDDLYRLMGDLQESLGDLDNARWCFEEALKLGGSPQSQNVVARKLRDLEAREILEQRGLIRARGDIGRSRPGNRQEQGEVSGNISAE